MAPLKDLEAVAEDISQEQSRIQGSGEVDSD